MFWSLLSWLRLLKPASVACLLPALALLPDLSAQTSRSRAKLDSERSFHGTFQELIESSAAAFKRGDYTDALNRFDHLEAHFGREEAFRQPNLQRALLPMHGYSAFLAGDSTTAIECFEAFLGDFPDAREMRSLVLFSLAQALESAADHIRAADRYEQFIRENPNRPETGIAVIRLSSLEHQDGRSDEALERLEQLYGSQAPYATRVDARMLALRIAMESENLEAAETILLGTRWPFDQMADNVSFAHIAMQIADGFLGEGKYLQAARSYALVPSKLRLEEIQRYLIREYQRSLQALSGSALGATGDQRSEILRQYRMDQLARLRAELEALQEAEDYTPGMLLRYGSSLLQAELYPEAEAVLADVAESPGIPPGVREEAHYRWIVTLQQMERWFDALAVARTFLEAFPNSSKVPLALFLVANSLQQVGEHGEAVEVLSDLMSRWPGHLHHHRWLFSRGFNRLFLEQYALARSDFESYRANHSGRGLDKNAQLWHALSYQFEKKYELALSGLDEFLAQTPPDHYLFPEALYRRGSSLYSLRDYERSGAQLFDFLQRFPSDRNVHEARVLLGDAYMGAGRLEAAVAAFRQASPERIGLFSYAMFQIGKIYRALEEYELLSRHFTEFLATPQAEETGRVSEALYQVGWARMQLGAPHEAAPLFLQAVERFGNDPNAAEVEAILAAMHRLAKSGSTVDLSSSAADPGAASALASRDGFLAWLAREKEQARAEGRPTLLLRLELFDRLQAQPKSLSEEEQIATFASLASEIPLDAFDAYALASVGGALLERHPRQSRRLFEHLLEQHPQSLYRGDAWLGLGTLLAAEGSWDEAAGQLQHLIEEMPAHIRYPEAANLFAQALIQLQRLEEAEVVLEDLLRLRSARGRPHAQALLHLALAAELGGHPERAIGYLQRVYNMYRAYPDFVGEAYLRSAKLFESRGDLAAAYRSYREMIFYQDRLPPEAVAGAEIEMTRLEQRLPPEELQRILNRDSETVRDSTFTAPESAHQEAPAG